jgi:hypothetical protein
MKKQTELLLLLNPGKNVRLQSYIDKRYYQTSCIFSVKDN